MEESLNKKLANALASAKAVSRDGVLQGSKIKASERVVLDRAGCLIDVLRGWYLLTKPGGEGSSTAWFGGFWAFLKIYLEHRFGRDGYCLSAEASLDLHAGENTISKQLVVITKKNSNQLLELLHNTSVLLYTDAKNFPSDSIAKKNGVNVMALPLALVRASPSYFQTKSRNIELLLKAIPSVGDITRVLLEVESPTSAARIVGAYHALGQSNIAEQISNVLNAAGQDVEPENPFLDYKPVLGEQSRFSSPRSGRLKMLWQTMRSTVIENFPQDLKATNPDTISLIQEIYSQDAYHSLSIEGYQVTEDLIQKIANGQWDPELEEQDRNLWNALAAKGYHNAFEKMLKSALRILEGENPGQVVQSDLPSWYQELFSPFVKAGLIQAFELAGFRRHQVYISNSRYVPPKANAVLDCMQTFFDLLIQEKDPGVRVVLGHFFFVYIHPYMDGNGRVGRFLMNIMLTAGGYPWTVIRTSKRNEYMEALEKASVDEDILPFTLFLKKEIEYWYEEFLNKK